MALKIRLTRGGAKKRPFYRIVVAEATAPRDGRFIERLGSYNPMLPADHADRVKLFEERVQHWLSVGAKPTERVERILGPEGLVEMPAIPKQTKSAQPKAEAEERLKAAQAAAEEAASA